jgi:integrase
MNDLLDANERSGEFCRLAARTRTDYLKGLADVGARYGSAPLGIVNSVALNGNVLDWIEVLWAGKGADKRLDPFKFALSWATGRHPERVPVNYQHGIPRFYEGADRAEIIWEDAEVDLFCTRAPEKHADAVRLARETGLRIGDLVELKRSEIKKAPDGSRAIILRPNKRRRRIVNMPLTAAAEAIIDKAPLSSHLILKPKPADARDPARLSREVREYATEFETRPELRFNDLRGTKVTEMVWSGIGVPDLAIRIGWKIETAAKNRSPSWRRNVFGDAGVAYVLDGRYRQAPEGQSEAAVQTPGSEAGKPPDDESVQFEGPLELGWPDEQGRVMGPVRQQPDDIFANRHDDKGGERISVDRVEQKEPAGTQHTPNLGDY